MTRRAWYTSSLLVFSALQGLVSLTNQNQAHACACNMCMHMFGEEFL